MWLNHLMTKPTKWHVHPAKTQISLGICPVWSESSLSAWRKLGSLATHWAHLCSTIDFDRPRTVGDGGGECKGCDFPQKWGDCSCINNRKQGQKVGQWLSACPHSAGLLAGLWWLKRHSPHYSPKSEKQWYQMTGARGLEQKGTFILLVANWLMYLPVVFRQTVQTQIRLIRVYTVCHSVCIFWTNYCMVTIWAASWQNQQNGMCAPWRFRSAWGSIQSDQSLRCALNG